MKTLPTIFDIKLLHSLIDRAATDAIVPRLAALLGLLNRPGATGAP